jgi:hypothetical protein
MQHINGKLLICLIEKKASHEEAKSQSFDLTIFLML